MAEYQTVWIDSELCTGCGACVEVCSPGALTLVNQVAQVDEEACTGCDTCIDACPQDAIQPVVEGEIVRAEARAVQVREDEEHLAPALDRHHPLIESAAPALAVAGVSLLSKAARAMSSIVGRWLLSSKEESLTTRSGERREPGAGLSENGGRRARRRRRGR